MRLRTGGRTYFSYNDPWRVEGYLAYGFRDQKVKYGIQAKALLDKKVRLIISAGNRRDVEQIGASLTASTDVLGRSNGSSSIVNNGQNNLLTNLNLSMLSLQIEPIRNVVFSISGVIAECNQHQQPLAWIITIPLPTRLLPVSINLKPLLPPTTIQAE